MMQKLWTMNQLELLKKIAKKFSIPKDVRAEVEKILAILDEVYGKERTTGNEDGGCVFLVIGTNEEERLESYRQILNEYKLDTNLVEFADILYEQNNIKWYSELYLLTEYGITVIYSKKEEKKE